MPIMWQQGGVAFSVNVDATSTLVEAGVTATDDSFKYIWFQVCLVYPDNLNCYFFVLERKKP